MSTPQVTRLCLNRLRALDPDADSCRRRCAISLYRAHGVVGDNERPDASVATGWPGDVQVHKAAADRQHIPGWWRGIGIPAALNLRSGADQRHGWLRARHTAGDGQAQRAVGEDAKARAEITRQ